MTTPDAQARTFTKAIENQQRQREAAREAAREIERDRQIEREKEEGTQRE